ncbi:Carbohydrate esterase family 4 protein [Mycena kentingensis (nom. inval.)]|nr:Carbohydrate esterase family 4 protein [Mycena kentingensis (nom. inval.)]
MIRLSALFSLSLLAVATALPRHDHEHTTSMQLPGAWYHRDDHPVRALFRRADDTSYAPVGSAEWSKGFPAGFATPKSAPDSWIVALNDALYPQGHDPDSPQVCSATYQCRIPGDIWDLADGYLALSFDDGPTAASNSLTDFLVANNQTATHFLIGSNLLSFPQQFLKAFANDDMAVHTWSHPYMTTLTNEQVVAEFGWTMQLIHNSTTGRVPRFWRPPYGDSDMRVRAIAKEVFSLITVIWNQNTNDWTLSATPPGTTLAKISASMEGWLKGKKTPGLNILEHELSSGSVQAFKSAYPVMLANDWKVVSLAQLVGDGDAYWNAADGAGPVTPVANVVEAKDAGVPQSSSVQVVPSGAANNNNNGGGASSAPSSSAVASVTGQPGSAARSTPAVLLTMLALFTAWLL